MGRLFIIFLLTSIAAFTGCAQKANENDIVVAFYNCENFFDTADDPVKQDEDFTPAGKYHYTQKIYGQKLHNIASVIQSMGGPDGPAIIGLAEVENNIVLNDLIRQPEIRRRNYKYEWFQGPDPRGINVALVYNPQYFHVINAGPLHVSLAAVNGKSLTRDVLHVSGILGGDTVHVFINHWPSRIGGDDESAPKRAVAAQVNRDAIDKIMKLHPDAEVIVMGDLNDNPTDKSVANVLGASGEKNGVVLSGLYDPFTAVFNRGTGTEVYRHNWNLFDQIIISGTFLQNRAHKLRYDKAEIFRPGFIVDNYKGHKGEPKRSFVGTHWINGYSDHFPVILYLAK